MVERHEQESELLDLAQFKSSGRRSARGRQLRELQDRNLVYS